MWIYLWKGEAILNTITKIKSEGGVCSLLVGKKKCFFKHKISERKFNGKNPMNRMLNEMG